MAIERSWIERFYSECGREVTLAYNTFNQTNNWGIALITGIVGVVFIAAIQSVEGKITFVYPTIPYWFVIILAWIIMTRFFVRSCLALVNMYRWNTLIYAASKILSLPVNHSKVQLFERNFAKKVKAYFYDWRSPIPISKLLRECFRLMYIWFFLILFSLIIWGFFTFYGQTLWLVGLLLFLLPTTWELHSLFTWRGFKYQPLNLEDEPDITTLWLDENKNGLSPKTVTSELRNGLLKKQVISQALTYFVFGLITILAFHISPSKSIPVISTYDILGTLIDIGRWLVTWAFVLIFVAAILWAITLFFISFRWRLVEQLDEARFKRIYFWNEFFYWPALVTVFGTGFASIWAHMANVGMGGLPLFIIYGSGITVVLILLVHHILSGRRFKSQKKC